MTLDERRTALQSFVEDVEGREVAWSVDDCTAWCAAWVKTLTGAQVPFLAEYGTREEAHAAIEAAGGLDVLWGDALAAVGIYPTHDAPRLGDIGIISTGRFGDVGVIFADESIALWRAARGTALLRPYDRNIVKVWPVG